nr:immunoglobulin heavy chain junction region [Mus musculus]
CVRGIYYDYDESYW